MKSKYNRLYRRLYKVEKIVGGKSITFILNGKELSIFVKAKETLIDVLRNRLGLTGTKDETSDNGASGVSTVLIDGKPVISSLTLAIELDGEKIETLEGLANGEKLHPLQEAFIDQDAVQCGYCIPAQIMTAKALLDMNSDPTRQEVQEAISGNMCRCTGYQAIINAILSAAKTMREGGE
jgi:carbon-monoxide dehydrogenase small subunit